MKKLYYVANIRMPTEKAHGIQITKMCEAFVRQGLEVELIVPKRMTPIASDPFEYYAVEPSFKITKLWCLDLVKWGRLGFWLESLTFAEVASWHLLLRKGFVYTRDEMVAFFLVSIGKKPVWEAHMGQANFFVRMLVYVRTPFVVITKGLKDLYLGLGQAEKKILVAPDAVDVEQFNSSKSKLEARTLLGFGKDEKIVLYTGHLYSWKGADTLAEAAKKLSPEIKIVFIGGTEKDLESFRSKYAHVSNISILGKKPHKEMPLYMRAADVLTIPNSAKEDVSRLYTSPMKLFEYMATGTPILASDLPSLREILNDDLATFAKPDDQTDWAQKINEVFAHYEVAEKKALGALNESAKYTWEKRSKWILEFLENSLEPK